MTDGWLALRDWGYLKSSGVEHMATEVSSTSIYQRLKDTRALPSPMGIALKVLRLTRSSNSTAAQIAKIMEVDPAMSSRILRIVNAPIHGLPRRIASVSRGVSLLGMRRVSQIALTFSLVSTHRDGRCREFDFELFWSDSLARGVAAKCLTERLGPVAPDEAFTCGLLSQIGRLSLASVFPDRYGQILRIVPPQDFVELALAEHKDFGINHTDLAAEMVADWSLPESFHQAIRAQLAPDERGLEYGSPAHQLARILELSAAISGTIIWYPAFGHCPFYAAMLANRLGLPPDGFREIFDRIRVEWREMGRVFSVRTREVPSLLEIEQEARQMREQFAGDSTDGEPLEFQFDDGSVETR